MTDSCLNCALANWDRTASGRLHPDGNGKCMFKWEPPALPKSMYFLGFRDGGYPNPSGGFIERLRPRTECPQFKDKGQ